MAPLVLLVCDRGTYGLGIALGAAREGQKRGWRCRLFDPANYQSKLAGALQEGAGVDAIVALVYWADLAQRLQATGLPTVNVSPDACGLVFPTVANDDRAVGAMAAIHLAEIGMRHFAVARVDKKSDIEDSSLGFVQEVERRGSACVVSPSLREGTELQSWLATLPPQVGIFAINDRRARLVIDACHSIGLAVPSTVAVVGSGDDLECELSLPTPEQRQTGR